MTLEKLARFQGMDLEAMRQHMEETLNDKPLPKGSGMKLAYLGLWPNDEIEVFVRFGRIVVGRFPIEGIEGSFNWFTTGDGKARYWVSFSSALIDARKRVSAPQLERFDAWVASPPGWAKCEIGQKWPLKPTPIEGRNHSPALGSTAKGRQHVHP